MTKKDNQEILKTMVLPVDNFPDKRFGQLKRTILLVEDEESCIVIFKSLLEPRHNLILSKNGKTGIERCIANLPDLVICSLQLSTFDGFSVCRILKQERKTCHIPIILVSHPANHDLRIRGLECGADAFFFKPIDMIEFKIRIKNLIGLRDQFRLHYYSKSNKRLNHRQRKEQRFLNKLRAITEHFMDQPEFGHHELEMELSMSKTQIYRKIKRLTGMSVALYIRDIRLQNAYQMLHKTDLNISQIAYAVGFKNASHFSRYFKEKYGHQPSLLRK